MNTYVLLLWVQEVFRHLALDSQLSSVQAQFPQVPYFANKDRKHTCRRGFRKKIPIVRTWSVHPMWGETCWLPLNSPGRLLWALHGACSPWEQGSASSECVHVPWSWEGKRHSSCSWKGRRMLSVLNRWH